MKQLMEKSLLVYHSSKQVRRLIFKNTGKDVRGHICGLAQDYINPRVVEVELLVTVVLH